MYKLIRDNMADIILKNDPEARVTSIDEVYGSDNFELVLLDYLCDKLHEETEELIREMRARVIYPSKVDEEAADVFEVLSVISELVGNNDFTFPAYCKRVERGSFRDGVLLDTTCGKMPEHSVDWDQIGMNREVVE